MKLKAVLLAAGLGRRMANACPKPLTNVMGKPLISYPLIALRKVGIEEALIVVGYKGHVIRRSFELFRTQGMKIRFVEAENFHRGNGASLAAAGQDFIQGSFLLAMADHIVSPELVERVLDSEPVSLGVEMLATDGSSDDTKVLVNEDGFIERIGKEIRKSNGIDTGIFKCDRRVIVAAQDLLAKKRWVTISDVMNHLVAQGDGLQAVNVSGLYWIDVDTPNDISRAEAALQMRPET